MFSGQIGKSFIVSDLPILAVDGERNVLGFHREEEATGFLLKTGNDTTTIFRHNGKGWEQVSGDPGGQG